LFERANRKFLKVLNYKDLGFVSAGGTKEAMQKLTRNIPFDVEQYFDSIAPHRNHLNFKIQQN
jgi:hypothetical protein